MVEVSKGFLPCPCEGCSRGPCEPPVMCEEWDQWTVARLAAHKGFDPRRILSSNDDDEKEGRRG